ncbi:MAG TPA: IS630 family transposase [Solirubrobacteraceae bacterium]|nr:IS630 family transposase [Solirubrobacteraceae bacterium]
MAVAVELVRRDNSARGADLAAKVTLREISNEEGNRLLRIVRRTSGSVVTWRRAQIVLLAAQGMTPTRISEVVFTDPDTVRDVIHNFNRDGFDALYPRYKGGRPPTFTLPKRQEIKRIALSDPQDLGQPFATWSLAKLADYLVAEGVVSDISHEGLRQLLHAEGVRFQAVRTWKRSNDPDFQAKRDRIVELYALADAGEAVVICLDEFGPLNLQPQPGGRGWAPRAKPKRIRATFTRPHGIRHLMSAYDVGADRLYGHIKQRKGRVEFLAFCRYVRSLYPCGIRLHFVLDNFSAHKGEKVRQWAADNNVELAYTPFYASWLNRIEAQFRALRYFTLAGTDHPDHATQARLIRRYIAWRNRNTDNPRLRALVNTANVA